MFSIRDKRAECWNEPFCSPNRATAVRRAELMLRDDPKMQMFAVDFSMWQMGTFEPTKGIEGCEPHHVVEVSELIPKDDNAYESAVTSIREQ